MNMRRYVEAQVQQGRVREARQASLEHMVWENKILAGHGKSERTVEKKRQQLEQEQYLRELMTDQGIVERAQAQERKKQVSKMEEQLANELEKRHAARIREAQNRKRICESSEELRSLKEKLHAAQVTKQRAAQIRDRQIEYEAEHQREQIMATVMEEDRLAALERQASVDAGKFALREEAKQLCLSQIRARELARTESRYEFEKERAMVDDVVRKIREEDEQEERLRRQKQEETRIELQNFAARQTEYRREEAERAAAELEEIEAYAQKKRAREQAIEDEKLRIEEEKRKAFFAMVGGMEAKQKEKEEMEYLRNELYHEEHEAHLVAKEKEKEQKMEMDRADMLRAYEQQMAMKEEKQRLEREEEMKLREQLQAKFAEDDRIEQMNLQKRRMKVQEHKREVENLILARRQLFENERQREMSIYAEAAEMEEKRLVIIEEERKRLLTEYGSALKDFLPKGVIEREADIPLVYGKDTMD